MKSNNIFIHIPKTGGTTINCLINKTKWQTKPDFFYRHILYETKRSNSSDIFNPVNYDKYLNYNIFMIVRHPIDRIISEYYFIKDREEFISLINPRPNNLIEYIKNRQTNNYMTGFLLGKRMYDKDYVTDDDLSLVKNTINQLNIKVGVFENYQKSMVLFSRTTGIKLPKNIDVKRITLNRPSIYEVQDDVKKIILKHNQIDIQLYEYCVQKFYKDVDSISIKDMSFKFQANKYNYVIKYTQRFVLLEIALNNKLYIKKQERFFSELNEYLHHSLKLNSGEAYVKIWNDTFVKTIKNTLFNSELVLELCEINKLNIDELEKTIKICHVLDNYTHRSKSVLKKELKFDSSIINKSLIPKKGIFSFFK
jgi:hypothetical protein